jgi:hypothetical protein
LAIQSTALSPGLFLKFRVKLLQESEDMYCFFGMYSSPAIMSDHFQFSCEVPSLLVGTGFGNNIEASVNLGMLQLLPQAFVVSVKPSAVSFCHSRVSVIGSNFVLGILATCKFNQILLTEGFTESQSTVTCAVPTINSTFIFVEVSFDGQTFVSSVNSSFVITDGIIIHFVQPETCRANANCVINIFGENFAENAYCELKDTPFSNVQIFLHNSSHVTCSFPTGDNDSLALSVCNLQSQCRPYRIHVIDDLISFSIDNQVIIARELVMLRV